jgi:hypothetical protein
MHEYVKGRCLNRRTLFISAGVAPIVALTGSATEAATKISQSAVHYQNAPNDGRDCDDCNHFMAPNACKLVAGAISPKGWCPLWARKAA